MKKPLSEKLPESVESFKFVSYRAGMPGEFDLKKDSHSPKLERRPRKFVKQNFREFCSSELSGLHPFDNVAIINLVKNRIKNRKVGCEFLRHQSLKEHL